MRWSKVKQLVEERFAPSLHGRVEVHRTQYRHSRDEYGRRWIALDKNEIVDMSDLRYLYGYTALAREIRNERGTTDYHDPIQAPGYYAAYLEAQERIHDQSIFSGWEAARALWETLSLSVDDMLHSENPIIRALAILDSRLGKRRLRALALRDGEHPLVKQFYELRCEAEGFTKSAMVP